MALNGFSGGELLIPGDAEAACIKILRTATEITGFSGGAPNVAGDLTGYEMGARWIMVSREGGSFQWPRIDRPRIDFQVYGPTRTVAHNMAQVAFAVLFRSMGTAFPEFGVFISDMQVETGLFRAPDKVTGSSRYIFSLRLACVPIPSS